MIQTGFNEKPRFRTLIVIQQTASRTSVRVAAGPNPAVAGQRGHSALRSRLRIYSRTVWKWADRKKTDSSGFADFAEGPAWIQTAGPRVRSCSLRCGAGNRVMMRVSGRLELAGVVSRDPRRSQSLGAR